MAQMLTPHAARRLASQETRVWERTQPPWSGQPWGTWTCVHRELGKSIGGESSGRVLTRESNAARWSRLQLLCVESQTHAAA